MLSQKLKVKVRVKVNSLGYLVVEMLRKRNKKKQLERRRRKKIKRNQKRKRSKKKLIDKRERWVQTIRSHWKVLWKSKASLDRTGRGQRETNLPHKAVSSLRRNLSHMDCLSLESRLPLKSRDGECLTRSTGMETCTMVGHLELPEWLSQPWVTEVVRVAACRWTSKVALITERKNNEFH